MAVITSAQRVVDAARKLSDAVGDVLDSETFVIVPRDYLVELRRALAAEMADDTWTKIVLEHANDAGVTVYFRWTEKGGLTRDPLEAAYATNANAGLDFMIREAAREFPRHNWQLRRLRVSVELFHHEKNVRDLVDRDVRQRALHKLTDREREVLGLTA